MAEQASKNTGSHSIKIYRQNMKCDWKLTSRLAQSNHTTHPHPAEMANQNQQNTD